MNSLVLKSLNDRMQKKKKRLLVKTKRTEVKSYKQLKLAAVKASREETQRFSKDFHPSSKNNIYYICNFKICPITFVSIIGDAV